MAPQQPDRTTGPYEPDDTDVTGGAAVTSEYGEIAADGGGEVRAAERSAERAAALAVTEGFHPLRVRPYVGDPDDTLGGAGSTVRPLIDVAAPDDGGPATTDLGLFPGAYTAVAAAHEYPADDGAHDAAAAAAARGRHRRRRRGIVVAAAAVAASALAAGAVAVTGSVMGDEQGGNGRAMPDPASAAPDVTLPAGAAPGAVTQPVKVTPHHPMRATTTPSPKVTHSTTPPPTTTAPTTTPPVSASATTSAPPQTTPPQTPSTPPVLQVGASGPEVTDLQQRLTEVWVYHGPVDGQYDSGVEKAVATFQIWYGVDGDPSGVYGPATRAALVHATGSAETPSHHH
ncbi:peptidoglycan-binding protein [Streptomyces sp. NPDC049040]|uniref:peptidoglycan-binding domain-containing protein n=1 Tax=Streptomyces sp. NPDC049040 TaxID=3365593 RepID=UPI0037216786